MEKMLKKKVCYSLIAAALFIGCNKESDKKIMEYTQYSGQTMGTTYNIKCNGCPNFVYKQCDSILIAINEEVSTYIDTSLISVFNIDTTLNFIFNKKEYPHFLENLSLSQQAYDISRGYFDPTVMPLVNAYGFGYKNREEEIPDTIVIDSLMHWVGFHKLKLRDSGDLMLIEKKVRNIQLDFSAVAKGYAVDVLSKHLSSFNYNDHFVEIGGEIRTSGTNSSGELWHIGINLPEEKAATTSIYNVVAISNQSLATSGNYRNKRDLDSITVVHTINPKTGRAMASDILSASIIAKRCAIADAAATAAMAMGLNKALEMVKTDDRLEGLFIYEDEKGELTFTSSGGFEKHLVHEE